jgi:uncharacterized protein
MLVKIDEIKEPGLVLSEAIAREVLEKALLEAGNYSLLSSSKLDVTLKKVSGQVHVNGEFGVTVGAQCNRCTANISLEVPVRFSLRMIREKPEIDPDENADSQKSRSGQRRQVRERDSQEEEMASFELDEIDAEPFDGKTIDLDPIVREQVMLALPLTVVCHEECKGLCMKCGQDLNESDCGHGKVKDVDIRLAKLKEIRLKN